MLPAVCLSDLWQFFRPFVLPGDLEDYVALFSNYTVLHFCYLRVSDIAELVRHTERYLPLWFPESKIVATDMKWVLYAACTAPRGTDLHAIKHADSLEGKLCSLSALTVVVQGHISYG